LVAKRAAELARVRSGLYTACNAQASVDILTRQIDELSKVIVPTKQPLALPIGGQPQTYAKLP
jgi:hypothetical protein